MLEWVTEHLWGPQNILLQSVFQAVSEVIEAGSTASASPRPPPGTPLRALPSHQGNRVGDSVLHSLDEGDFDRIMPLTMSPNTRDLQQNQYSAIFPGVYAHTRKIRRGSPADSVCDRDADLGSQIGRDNFFLRSRHATADTDTAEASSGRQSMWSTQNRAATSSGTSTRRPATMGCHSNSG